MPYRRGAILFLCLTMLFLIANRGAYKSWFNDDDLDNLQWTRSSRTATFATGLLSPQFADFNFRPVGHLYYHFLAQTVGVNYRWYIALLHGFHLLNAWMVWLLVRRLGSPPVAAGAATLFFAFHIACFDAYWKPMYVFDVLCGTFSLLTLLVYLHGFPLLALIPFWLAYKAKELAITLPVILLLYEWSFGGRRWKHLVPYFAVSFSFGLQGLVANRAVDNDYTLRFSWAALGKTATFYLSKVFLAPYAGFAVLPALLLMKNRRITFGVLAALIAFGPLWFLPGRMFAVYLYVPLIFIAIALAAAAERLKPWWLGLFFLFWIPLNYAILRENRKMALTVGPENRAFFEATGAFLKANPHLKRVVYDGHPPHLAEWGVAGTFRWFRPDPQFEFISFTDSKAAAILRQPGTGVLSWEKYYRTMLTSANPNQAEFSYVDFSKQAPIWLLEEGWYGLEARFRWTAPRATVRLLRPAAAKEFVVVVNLGPAQKKALGGVTVEIRLNGVSLGKRRATEVKWQDLRWPLPRGEEQEVLVELIADPPVPPGLDPRALGAAVGAIGFR